MRTDKKLSGTNQWDEKMENLEKKHPRPHGGLDYLLAGR